MGMDLKPINPSKDAPRNELGDLIWGRYNWSGWRWLAEHLEKWDCKVQLSGTNDGEVITENDCICIAAVIETHLFELSDEDRRWIEPHIARWRHCGGYEQW